MVVSGDDSPGAACRRLVALASLAVAHGSRVGELR